jgi:hypothetical protein
MDWAEVADCRSGAECDFVQVLLANEDSARQDRLSDLKSIDVAVGEEFIV